MRTTKIVIIGGGASGLMAAITAARQGAAVTILEHMDRVGKKLLSTGNGKCNFTNQNQNPENYRGSEPSFAKGALSEFTLLHTLQFFKTIGIYPKNKNGGFYPSSEQASAVLDVLRMEADFLHVQTVCSTEVTQIRRTAGGFLIKTNTGTEPADRLILAAGSKAAPKTGSDGSGYILAKSFCHTIIPPLPALVQLKSGLPCFKALAGVRADGEVRLYKNAELLSADRGEIQFTNYGISGIPVFQVSRFAAQMLKQKQSVTAKLDFLPDFTPDVLYEFLENRWKDSKNKSMEEALIGLFHKKLAVVLLKEAGLSPSVAAKDMNQSRTNALLRIIKGFSVPISGTNSFDQAQVCSGGVYTAEVDSATMESKLVPGLYFAGEILDIDGACGGYNLQWAWSSGYTAGYYAARKEQKERRNDG